MKNNVSSFLIFPFSQQPSYGSTQSERPFAQGGHRSIEAVSIASTPLSTSANWQCYNYLLAPLPKSPEKAPLNSLSETSPRKKQILEKELSNPEGESVSSANSQNISPNLSLIKKNQKNTSLCEKIKSQKFNNSLAKRCLFEKKSHPNEASPLYNTPMPRHISRKSLEEGSEGFEFWTEQEKRTFKEQWQQANHSCTDCQDMSDIVIRGSKKQKIDLERNWLTGQDRIQRTKDLKEAQKLTGLSEASTCPSHWKIFQQLKLPFSSAQLPPNDTLQSETTTASSKIGYFFHRTVAVKVPVNETLGLSEEDLFFASQVEKENYLQASINGLFTKLKLQYDREGFEKIINSYFNFKLEGPGISNSDFFAKWNLIRNYCEGCKDHRLKFQDRDIIINPIQAISIRNTLREAKYDWLKKNLSAEDILSEAGIAIQDLEKNPWLAYEWLMPYLIENGIISEINEADFSEVHLEDLCGKHLEDFIKLKIPQEHDKQEALQSGQSQLWSRYKTIVSEHLKTKFYKKQNSISNFLELQETNLKLQNSHSTSSSVILLQDKQATSISINFLENDYPSTLPTQII